MQMSITGVEQGAASFGGQRATSVLTQEHGLILTALAVLASMLDRLAVGEPVPRSDLERLLEFFRRFADAAHHAKEEEVLFPALEVAGLVRQGGPIAVMNEEHDRCRRLILTLTEELPEIDHTMTARTRFVAAARTYSELLKHHIEKENTVLFQIAQRLLGADEEQRLVKEFDRHVRVIMEPGETERLVRSVEELAASWIV